MTALQPMPTLSPSETLKELFWKLKRSRIRISPVHTTRGSSIGHECERFLFYERTAHELRVPHEPETQAIFDLGNELEPYVVREIEAMGVQVLQRGRDYHDREHELTGHMDAKLMVPGFPTPLPAEIKGLNPFTADGLTTLADIRDSHQAWVRKYYAQLQTYLLLDGSDFGVFALLNKVSGRIEFIDCPLDRTFAEGLLAKADRVRDAVRANNAPPRHQTTDCARCPFAHVCLPDQHFGPGVQILDEPELIAAIEQREQHRDAYRAFQAADRAVKELLPEQAGELLVGAYAVVSKEIHRKAYSVEAGSYFKHEVREVKKL